MFTWCRLRSLRARCLFIQLRRMKQRTYEQDFKVIQQDDAYPRITVPQKMVENLAKLNMKNAKEKALKDRLHMTDNNLVIICKRKEFNHYKGQTYKVFDPKRLASYGWKHRNCPPDYFTIVANGKNPSVSFSKDDVNFGDMKLDKEILNFLEQEGIEEPTKIQSLMIPAMKSRNHIVCAAETGSGKTYAYLIPCVQAILKKNMSYAASERQETRSSPNVVIIMPTIELARQVNDFCDKMADCVPFDSVVLHGSGDNVKELMRKDGMPMDILISTPGTLKRVIDKKMISISKLRTLVLDEADSLLDDSFNHVITSIFQKSEIDTSIAVQVVLVSATFPRDIDSILGEYVSVDSFTKITTDHLHMISPHVTHKFIKMKSIDKLENILTLLKSKKQKSTMVFCNNNDTCHWLSQTLKETGVDSVCLTAFHNPQERLQIYKSFTGGEFKVLICTDIASRGLDTTAVHHVVNFDFPTFISDYIHRAGRVGRVGSTYSGQVTSFIVHRWDVDLVWKIEVAVRSGKQIHNVNANIKRKLDALQEEKQGIHED